MATNWMPFTSLPQGLKAHLALARSWQRKLSFRKKSAHTALAVKACLLGCKTATLNAQVTFVNIAVAISALAGGATQKFSHRASISLVFLRFFDDFLGLEIKMVLKSNFGSFWCLCGSNFGSFWWLSGAIPTRVHSKNFAPGPYIAGVFAVFSTIFWGWRSRWYWNRILGPFGASVDRILGHFGGSLVQFLLLRGF